MSVRFPKICKQKLTTFRYIPSGSATKKVYLVSNITNIPNA